MNDQVDSFKEDRVIGVVLVHVLCYLGFIHYLKKIFVYLNQIGRLILGRREHLEKLKHLDLQPRARSLVIEIVSGMGVYVSQDFYQLVD